MMVAPEVQLGRSLGIDEEGPGQLQDRLLMLGEDEALHVFFDEINGRRLRFQLWVLLAIVAIHTLVFFIIGNVLQGAVMGIVTLGDLVLLRARMQERLRDGVRQVCAGVLVGHLLLLNLIYGLSSDGVELWYLFFAILAARYRLLVGEVLALFGALYAVVAVRLVGLSLLFKSGLPIGQLIGAAIVHLIGFAIAVGLTSQQKRRFLARFRAEAGRQRERLRMKQELEYAREIQLSMLPREAPEVGWLDIAALSLPATEVGGDYYDYFQPTHDKLAVVVGDVTGHGVASGLVLSGVRSCLNLLADEMISPRSVLERVNLMLKRTSTPRMLMTLGVAVFDSQATELTVATAGHPPILICRAGGAQVIEIGRGSLPLGVRDDGSYSEEVARLERGDVVLLYSDGLVESCNADGELFGWGRLHEILAVRCAAGEAARDIRTAILNEVWSFKGDTEQMDDVTMVVVRVV